MPNNIETNPFTSPADPNLIEVHLTPESTRQCLSMSLRRTRRRAGKLVAELVQTSLQPQPDLARIRLLAEGVRFETGLAHELALALDDVGPPF